MEGIIFDIKRFSVNDGPGLRTTVFFKGCPLNCLWCHNPESKKFGTEQVKAKRRMGERWFDYTKNIGYTTTTLQVLAEVEKERVFMEQGHGGVTLSGGEPLAQAAFTLELLRLLKQHGFHTAIDTSGGVAQSNMEMILPYTDVFLYDLKSINPYQHKKCTGIALSTVWKNLEFLMKKQATIQLRIPLIPGVNLSTEESQRMVKMLGTFNNPNFKEVHLLPFHKLGKGKMENHGEPDFFTNTPEPSTKEVEQFALAFREAGFLVHIH